MTVCNARIRSVILSSVNSWPAAAPYQGYSVSVTPGEDPKFYLDQVHGGRELHLGARQTWQKLSKHFPGHKIPLKVVDDYVKACPAVRRTDYR